MLTKHRGGEVAILVLKDRLRKEGLHLHPNDFKRNLANAAKRLEVPYEELLELSEGLMRELMDEVFAKAKK